MNKNKKVRVEYDEVGSKYETHYKNGETDGLETCWYESGEKMYELTNKNGKRDGLGTWYSPKGKKESEINYKNGEEQGWKTEFDKDGVNILYKVYMKDGKQIEELEDIYIGQ